MGNITPSNGNLYLGAGVLDWDIWANGAKTGLFYDLGDVSEFNLDYKVDVAEKRTSRVGARSIYKTAVKGVSAEFSLKLSEWSARNFAIGSLGSRTDFTQSTSTKTDQAPLNDPQMQKGGKCYIGFRGVTGFTLKQAPATSLVLNTDYTFDAETGQVTILTSSPTFVNGSKLLWSGTVPAVLATAGRSVIAPLQAPMVMATLRFKSDTQAVSGPRYDAYFPQVQFYPNAAQEWLKDDFSDLSLTGRLMFDTTQAAGLEYGTIVEL